jgi:effector-binding domain-containing protein
MFAQPTVVERDAQPYVGIERAVTIATLYQVGEGIRDLFGWLTARGQTPAGPPFFKYDVIDMARELIVEAGVAVDAPMAGDDTVVAGVLPAGRYVSLTHLGHPDELEAATDHLLRWAAAEGLSFDQHPSEAGDVWACRLELYLTDPAEEPDMAKWTTELLFKLAD